MKVLKKLLRYCGVRALLLCALALAAPLPLCAHKKKITIKLASLVPERTPWGEALNKMAADWAKASGGEVELVIYHNGVAGGEDDVLRKLKMNQMQAAILSSFGLSDINRRVFTLSCPFLIRDNAELDFVLRRIKPSLEAGLNEKGFFTLAWSKVGWVRFFSKTPVRTPADLKKLRLGTSDSDPELTGVFKAMGYRLVPVAHNQILVNLSGGMIDAVYQSPVAAASSQLFGAARNMCSLLVAPFMGGIVINNATWRAVPDAYKPELLRIAKNLEQSLDSSIVELEDGMVRIMASYGLVINTPTPAQEQLWFDDVEKAMPALLDRVYERDIYEEIGRLLDGYRRAKPAAPY